MSESKSKESQIGRRFVMCVETSGQIFVIDRQAKGRAGKIDLARGLPVYSTDTEQEADSLILFRCRRARDGSGVYTLNTFGGGIEEIEAVGEMFHADHLDLARSKATG